MDPKPFRKKKRRPRLATPLPLGLVLEVSGEHKRSPYPPPIDLVVWARLTGPGIARRSEPRFLRDGILTVQVTSSAWAQELTFLHDSLLARLNAAGFAVRQLRFRVGPLPGKEPAPVRPVLRAPAPTPANVAEALRHLEDPELREVLAEASHYLEPPTTLPRPPRR